MTDAEISNEPIWYRWLPTDNCWFTLGEMITATYDDTVDVLYISLVGMIPECGEEDEEWLIWKWDSSGNPQGVTILDFKEDWMPKADILVHKIADFLGFPVSYVGKAIESCFKQNQEEE